MSVLNVRDVPALRVVPGVELPVVDDVADPDLLQELWVEEYLVSLRSRGFSPATTSSLVGSLDRLLSRCPVFVWELTPRIVDELLAGLTRSGLATSSRRNQLGDLIGFHRFVRARKASEVEARFGVVMVDPVDEFNSILHVSDEAAASKVPPSVEQLDEFFEVLRVRVGTARKYAPAARDYALFRMLYWTGLRSGRSGRARCRGSALGSGPVRQDSCPVRQRRPNLGPATAVGADARRLRSGAGLVRERCAAAVLAAR